MSYMPNAKGELETILQLDSIASTLKQSAITMMLLLNSCMLFEANCDVAPSQEGMWGLEVRFEK